MIDWTRHWETLANEPYKGITVDGNVIPNLFHLSSDIEVSAPIEAMKNAAVQLLDTATPSERTALAKPIHAPEWRHWANPEIYIYRHGIRLEEVSNELVDAVYDLMRASLSPTGYVKAWGCMKVNKFLGEVVNGRKVLNEGSYNFCLFGMPSQDEPWGWQIFGHHFCMNCMMIKGQMVISPIFMGAEPNIIDEGPDNGRAFHRPGTARYEADAVCGPSNT